MFGSVSKMEKYSYSSCDGVPWQATWPCFILNIKDKLLAVAEESEINNQTSPKKLTEEAIYMIYVILVIVALAVLGTSITAYEFFFRECEKKSESRKRGCDDDIASTRPKTLKDYLEAIRSFLKCFCILQNGNDILSMTPTEDHIGCFEGLRCLTNIFIIGEHTLAVYINIASHSHKLKILLDSSNLSNGLCTVDIFFFISGFLNARSFYNLYSRSKGKVSWPYFFFKRFARLTPLYMFVLGFYATLFSYTGNGILWPTYDTNPICKKGWWKHLFYINNLGETSKMCLPWCWSLANEMQYHIISPIFMVLLLRWPELGFALTFACIIGSCVIFSAVTYQYNLIDNINRIEFYLEDLKQFLLRFQDYADAVHTKPYTRITPYLIGILIAYYLYKRNYNKEKTRISKMTLCCGWILSSGFLWFYLFFPHKTEEVLMRSALYNGLKDLFFSCASAWMIYLFLTSHLEFLNKCLSWKFFLPLSRLSYGSYLVHLIVLLRVVLQAQNVVEFRYMSLIWLYFYTLGVSFVASFLLCIFVETPASNLLDRLKKKKEKKKSNLHLH